MKKKILLTGGTGFLGKEFLRLYADEYEIFATARRAVSIPGVQIIPVDLSSDFDSRTFPDKIDAIVHLAQSEHFRQFPEKGLDIFRVNAYSTIALLEYAQKAGAKKFLLASTGSVYGGSDTVITEETPIRPDSFYAESKLAAERLVLSYEKFMMPVILRYFFIYGPGQENRLIPGLIQKVLEGKSVALAGKRGLRLNPLFVTDAAAMVRTSLEGSAYGIFNAGGENPSDLRGVCETLGRLSDKAPHFEEAAESKVHFAADLSKFKKAFDFQFQYSLENGLKQTLEAARPSRSH